MARKRLVYSPDLFSLRCSVCGRALEGTVSGYLACREGHGKLVEDRPEPDAPPECDTCGSLFDPETPTEE